MRDAGGAFPTSFSVPAPSLSIMEEDDEDSSLSSTFENFIDFFGCLFVEGTGEVRLALPDSANF